MESNKRFEKSIKSYILKNKDIPILTFDYEKTIDKTSVGEYPSYKIKHIKILREDLLPAGYPNTVDSSKLRDWIERRKIPRNRKNMENVINFRLNELELDKGSFMNYIDISFGLSLNDSYWVVPAEKELLWKDYNLYQNKFSEVISLVAFGEKGEFERYPEEIRTSPEYTTDGMLAKCWSVIDNKICLLKKSSEHHKKEAYAEYYMSQVAEIMGFEHIEYDIIKFHENIVSSCSLFTSEDVGFIPMYYCMKNEDIHKKEGKLLAAVSKIYGKEKLEDLMVFDSLIYNTDRHLGNLGMLVDNNTRKILKAAPIFDNGNSILSLLDDKTNVENIFKRYTSKFEVDFDILSNNFVQKRHKENLMKLEKFTFKRHPKYNLSEEILVKAEKFISERAKFINRQLQRKMENTVEKNNENVRKSKRIRTRNNFNEI